MSSDVTDQKQVPEQKDADGTALFGAADRLLSRLRAAERELRHYQNEIDRLRDELRVIETTDPGDFDPFDYGEWVKQRAHAALFEKPIFSREPQAAKFDSKSPRIDQQERELESVRAELYKCKAERQILLEQVSAFTGNA